AMKKAWALLISLAAGGLVGLLRTYGELVKQLGKTGRPQGWLETLQRRFFIPEELHFPQWLNPLPHSQMIGFAFEPSVLLIGAGMITGLRVSLSMLLGSALLYFVVTPHLFAVDLSHVGVPGYVPSFTPNGKGDILPTRWAL